MDFVAFYSHPVVHGALAGLLSAAAIDFQAFRAWVSYDDLSTFDWTLASFRWLQGIILGAVTALGASYAV